jgi:hypothetical protein
MKILAVIAGVFFAALLYLESQHIVNVNWDKLQTISNSVLSTITTTANSTTTGGENRPIYQIAKTGQKRCSKYIVSYDNMWEKGKTREAGDAGGGAVSIMNSQIPQASDSNFRDEAAIRALYQQ